MCTEAEKKEMCELASQYAIENFKHGLNCAESVYNALVRAGALDVSPETVAMCLGFGGGVGLSGCICGAWPPLSLPTAPSTVGKIPTPSPKISEGAKLPPAITAATTI